MLNNSNSNSNNIHTNDTCSLCLYNKHIDMNVNHLIIDMGLYRVVWAYHIENTLHYNDYLNYPFFIRVIWNQHVSEMSDLSQEEQIVYMTAVFHIEQVIRTTLNPPPDKINLASFGNYAPHLHWHIIPRYKGDAHWPESVFSAYPNNTKDLNVNALNSFKQWENQRLGLAQAISERLLTQ